MQAIIPQPRENCCKLSLFGFTEKAGIFDPAKKAPPHLPYFSLNSAKRPGSDLQNAAAELIMKNMNREQGIKEMRSPYPSAACAAGKDKAAFADRKAYFIGGYRASAFLCKTGAQHIGEHCGLQTCCI